MPKTINIDRVGDVEYVTLNRPKQLNAINGEMMDELLQYFSGLDMTWFKPTQQGTIGAPRVVVLRGAGRAFSAGADLNSNDSGVGQDVARALMTQRKFSEIIVKMRKIPQPIIALLHGATCGGGLALALGADVRLCDSTFKANVAMAKVGFGGADLGISYLLPRIIGLGKASEMMLTGRFITQAEAKEWGLVNATFTSQAEVVTAGEAMAKDMLSLTPFALSLTKQAINTSLGASSLDTQVHLEDRQQILASLHPDFSTKIMEFFTRPRDTNKL